MIVGTHWSLLTLEVGAANVVAVSRTEQIVVVVVVVVVAVVVVVVVVVIVVVV
jgi:hypothetical protein